MKCYDKDDEEMQGKKHERRKHAISKSEPQWDRWTINNVTKTSELSDVMDSIQDLSSRFLMSNPWFM